MGLGVLLALLLGAGACREVGEGAGPRIAYVGALSGPGAHDRTGHALQGLQLALESAEEAGSVAAPLEVVEVDAAGDPGGWAEEVTALAADPRTLAVVIAPFWAGPIPVGVDDPPAVLALSSWAEAPPGPAGDRFFRLVPGQRAVGEALADAIAALPEAEQGTCLAEAPGAQAEAMVDRLVGGLGPGIVDRLDATGPVGTLVEGVLGAGCGVLAWLGDATVAAEVRTALGEAGLGDVVMAGGESLKDPRYLFGTDHADGTLVVCGCADTSTDTSLWVRRFVSVYQARFGSVPGVYAAEGWDVGHLLAQATGSAGEERAAVAAALRALEPFAGFAGRYAFAPDGEGRVPAPEARRFRALGTLWVAEDEVRAPTRRPGVLAAAVCAGRPPFATGRSQPRGFEVDLLRLVATELGLRADVEGVPCGDPAVDPPSAADVVALPAGSRMPGAATSRPFFSARLAFTVDRFLDDPPRGPADLAEGQRVGLLAGTGAEGWAEANLPGAVGVRVFGDPEAAFDALAAGRVRAVVADEPTTMREIEHRAGLQAVRSLDVGARAVLAVPGGPDAPRLVEALDEALGRLVASGALARVWAGWLPGVDIPPEVLRAS